ncbi:hypothetical protein [Hyphomicrobium sp.]|uniref:hypothetical protein n=1 Tax=Hyphomicrobium sp. TaxID=82 RepID=UPI002E368C87|nr:hypothetical protein [Hyphomicrobium sp.]HEX2839808.1 hypothetical protein [Hyphomicrobium sp.]
MAYSDHVPRRLGTNRRRTFSELPPWLSVVALNSLRIASYILSAVTLVFLVLVLERCRHGLDFTDESFFLNWISNPWIYPFSISQFGFFYHPFYLLVQGDIVLLRQLNILATFGLALVLIFALVRDERPWRGPGWTTDLAVSFTLALPSLFFLLQWIATPGYNSQTLQGLLLAAIGVVMNRRSSGPDDAHFSPAPAIALGIGGWMVALAKPSSAGLLAPAALFMVLATGRRPLRTLVVATGTALALVVATVFIVDGSPVAFANRIHLGMVSAFEQSPRYGIKTMLTWHGLWPTKLEIVVFCALAAASAALMLLTKFRRDIGAMALGMLAVVAAGLACALMLRPELALAWPRIRIDTAVLLAAAPCGVIAAAVLLAGWQKLLSRRVLQAAALTIFLVLCTYFFAVGTNTAVARRSLWALVFVGAAGVVASRALLSPRLARTAALTIAAVGLPISVLMLVYSMETPYRSPTPLRKQTTELSVGPSPSTKILIDEEAARYITELRTAFHENGGAEGTPVLDLTGASPGALFAIGAKAVALPWMIGGYPGSESLANRALSFVPCAELARTWLLLSPSGTRPLPNTLLNRAGLNVPRVSVARVREPNGEATQIFERPEAPHSGAACSP